MRKSTIIITGTVIFALLIFFSYSPVIRAADKKPLPVARVSVIHGTVKNTTTSKTLKLFDAIHKGDLLDVTKGASVRLIFYRDYHEEELDGACTATVDEKGANLSSGDSSKKKTTRKVYKVKLAENRATRGKEIAGGASRIQFLKPAKHQIYPISNIIELPKKRTFSWQPPQGVKIPYYRVTLGSLDSVEVREGEKAKMTPLLEPTVVTTTSLTLPDTLKPLESGKTYVFSVEGFLKHPRELGAEFDDSRIAASEPPYIFIMPSPEVVRYINDQEAQCKKLSAGTDSWFSQSLMLFSLYMGYGADDKAAHLCRELLAYGKDSDLFKSNEYLEGLMKTYVK